MSDNTRGRGNDRAVATPAAGAQKKRPAAGESGVRGVPAFMNTARTLHEWLLLLRGRLWLRTETFARLVSLPRVPAQTWQQAWLLPNGNGVDLWAASGVEGDLMKKDWAHPFFS